jgi:hypothetical protein
MQFEDASSAALDALGVGIRMSGALSLAAAGSVSFPRFGTFPCCKVFRELLTVARA